MPHIKSFHRAATARGSVRFAPGIRYGGTLTRADTTGRFWRA